MSASANKTMIGAFVLGALALAVAAVVGLGAGMFFTKKYDYIMYFENSVSGLEVGAPVVFRGVPIGSVKEISIDADPTRLHFYIPVVVEILSGKVKISSIGPGGKSKNLMNIRDEDEDSLLTQLIDKGLRAQLITQSFVTGQLAVSLDLMPGTPVRLIGNSDLPEIPTVPSMFEKLTQTIKQLPLEQLVKQLIDAVTGVKNLVNSPEIKALPGHINTILNNGSNVLDQIRQRVNPLADRIDEAVGSFTELAKHLDHRSEGLSSSAGKALVSLDAALKESKTAMTKFQSVVNSDSPTVNDLNRALSELAGAARSLRELSDYLVRHPEALLQGKGGPRK